MNIAMIRKVVIILSIIILVLSISVLGLLLAWVSILIFKGKSMTEDMESNQYRFFRYDPSVKESRVGFMKISTTLPPEGFISYEAKSGALFLISNSDVEEYTCSGACYCEENERRISGSMTISQGLIYLVAAVTSVVAIDLAEEYFEEKCHEKFAGSCHPESIRSDVEYCDRVHSESSHDNSDESVEVDSKPGDKMSESHGDFICQGGCFPLNHRVDLQDAFRDGTIDEMGWTILRKNMGTIQDTAMNYGCERLVLDSVVKVDGNLGEHEGKKAALKIFVEDKLQPFCIDQSIHPFQFSHKWGQNMEIKFSICGGLDIFRNNPTARCVMMTKD